MAATMAIAHAEEKHQSIERISAPVREALSHLGGSDKVPNREVARRI